MQGIRCLDLRLLAMECKSTGEVEYWTGHSFRLQKLTSIVQEIKAFIEANPKEFIFILIKADWSPMNDIKCCCFGGWSMNMCGCCQRDMVVKGRLR